MCNLSHHLSFLIDALTLYVYIYNNDCIQTDSIQSYLNSRVKQKSGFIQKRSIVSKAIIETNTGDDSDTVKDDNEGML